MSDNPITHDLASSAELDARLQRMDEDRWLASRYAPALTRPRLVLVWLFRLELQRALQAREPMLAKIRIQWWRETVEGFRTGTARRHDLSEALAAACHDRPDLVDLMLDAIDAFDDVADDHLHAGGHAASEDHLARHAKAEAACTLLAAQSLAFPLSVDEKAAARICGEAWVLRAASAPTAADAWSRARKASASLRAAAFPAIAHLALQGSETPLARRWRLFSSVLTQRPPKY